MIMRKVCICTGFPLEFYFRGHKSPLTLIQGGISGDLRGQSYDTLQKKANFRGHYVSRDI